MGIQGNVGLGRVPVGSGEFHWIPVGFGVFRWFLVGSDGLGRVRVG